MIIELNCHLNQRALMQTILSSCLARFIRRLSLRHNLNLLESATKLSKLSKFIVQLLCNRFSDIADCLTFFLY